jgi:hypothetical protein
MESLTAERDRLILSVGIRSAQIDLATLGTTEGAHAVKASADRAAIAENGKRVRQAHWLHGVAWCQVGLIALGLGMVLIMARGCATLANTPAPRDVVVKCEGPPTLPPPVPVNHTQQCRGKCEDCKQKICAKCEVGERRLCDDCLYPPWPEWSGWTEGYGN